MIKVGADQGGKVPECVRAGNGKKGFSPKLGRFFSQCGWGHGEVDAVDSQLLRS